MKQGIVVRGDLDMGVGKLAAQVAHASLTAYEQADRDARRAWKRESQKKVVLKVADESELHALKQEADAQGLPTALIRDAGHTQLEPGTVTTLGIGPASDEAIDGVTGDLSLY